MKIIIEVLSKDNFITSYLFPILEIIVPSIILFITVRYTYKKSRQLLMEDKSPMIILENFNTTKEKNYINTHKFYVESSDFSEENLKKYKTKKSLRYLELKNIGEGPALNVRFYNLYDGKQIEGNLVSDNSVDLASFPTIIIPKDKVHKFSMVFKSVLLEAKSDIDKPLYMGNEFLILVVYNDVFNKRSDLIIHLLFDPNKDIFEFSTLLKTDEKHLQYKNKYASSYNKIYSVLNSSLNKIEREKNIKK